MPKISLFELDGNHFGVWSPPPVDTCKTHQAKDQAFPNTKLLPPFDIKGKGLTISKSRLL